MLERGGVLRSKFVTKSCPDQLPAASSYSEQLLGREQLLGEQLERAQSRG
jgi:hypothetical protein